LKRRALPSLEPILAEVRYEREGQLRHFDALDQKAGILLGFAGALVALAPTQANPVVDVGRGLAVIAAGAALSAFWPRRYRAIVDLRLLRERYLAADQVFTLQTILDTQIAATQGTYRTLASKVRRLKLAMISLAAAAGVVALGLGVT
jgi:hypothetical protein